MPIWRTGWRERCRIGMTRILPNVRDVAVSCLTRRWGSRVAWSAWTKTEERELTGREEREYRERMGRDREREREGEENKSERERNRERGRFINHTLKDTGRAEREIQRERGERQREREREREREKEREERDKQKYWMQEYAYY